MNELGGVDMVAEMTGRKGRMIKKPDGDVVYEKRNANGISMTMQARASERFYESRAQLPGVAGRRVGGTV